MKHKKVSFILLMSGLGLINIQAQVANPASGGNASGNGGSSSYTVGQVVYTINTGTNGSVAQGVQQPYEISVFTSIEVATGINLQCIAYPNPVNDILTLNIENFNIENLSYQLYDINGKLLDSQLVTASQTGIPMENYDPGTYFLKVIQNSNTFKTFKIIKN